jgi:hypothetical protein
MKIMRKIDEIRKPEDSSLPEEIAYCIIKWERKK